MPSTVWHKRMGEPLNLACVDVFEPGETVLFGVTPLHPNNPAYGNIQGLVSRADSAVYDPTTGGGANNPAAVGAYPYLASQFDGHEGIDDETVNGDTLNTADRVTRLENGTLTIGYLGYRIVQPPQAI